MKGDKWLDLSCEQFIIDSVLNSLPSDFPNKRNLVLQCAKLQRLLAERSEQNLLAMEAALSGKATKNLKRRERQLSLQVGNQIKKLRLVLNSAFKDWLKKGAVGALGGKKTKLSNADLHIWKQKWEEALKHHKKKLMAQVKQGVLEKIKAQKPKSIAVK